MYDYDEYENYYEPTVADGIFVEYQQKMKDILWESVKDEVKTEIKKTNEENIKLKKENEKFKKREKDLSAKERDLKYKEDNIKREVEKEFYSTNIGDVLKEFVENCELWFADEQYYQGEKCNLCNPNRELIAKFKNGKTTKTECECAKKIRRFSPALTYETVIKFSKKDSRYQSDRIFYFSRSYEPSKDSSYYDRDYSYSEFKIGYIVDEFNDKVIELREGLRYGEKLGFRSKEECQKYCDWLNEKIKVTNNEVLKPKSK